MRFDYAVAVGRLAAREIRAGRWDEHRKIASRTYDAEEFDVIALAAVSLLAPGPVPEPFASWINLARDATASGLTPDDLVERIGAGPLRLQRELRSRA